MYPIISPQRNSTIIVHTLICTIIITIHQLILIILIKLLIYPLLEKPLLSSAPPLCDEIQFKWSSYVRASEDRPCHSAILSFSEPPKFWTPYARPYDDHPCLEVEFKGNHVVTMIELRGEFLRLPY